MPTCESCHKKWSWKQTIKKTTTLNPEMICPYCGEKQYQSKKSKKKVAFLTLTVLLPLLIQAFFNVPVAALLSLIPLLAIFVFLLYPFSVELKCKEEYIIFPKDL